LYSGASPQLALIDMFTSTPNTFSHGGMPVAVYMPIGLHPPGECLARRRGYGAGSAHKGGDASVDRRIFDLADPPAKRMRLARPRPASMPTSPDTAGYVAEQQQGGGPQARRQV